MAVLNPDEIRQRARQEWRLSAPGWKKWDKLIMAGVQPVSDQLIQATRIARGCTVLDMATGTGEPALTIAKILGPEGRVVGVDISPEMLEIARERAAHQGLSNVRFQVAEDENLSFFPDGSFDVVLCRFGLMFMPDPVKALSAFRRVLKPNGKASVSVWGSPEKTPFIALPMKTIAKHVPDIKPPPPGTPGSPFGIPRADMLRDMFVKAGFSNYNAQVTEIVLGEANSPEDYWQFISEVAGPLILLFSKLPEEKKQVIRNDVIESVRRMFPNGPIKLTGEVIVGTGTKL